MQKVKIGFVAENAIGGVAYYVLGQISLLNPEQFECSVYLLNFSWRNVSPAKHLFPDAVGDNIKMNFRSPFVQRLSNFKQKIGALVFIEAADKCDGESA